MTPYRSYLHYIRWVCLVVMLYNLMTRSGFGSKSLLGNKLIKVIDCILNCSGQLKILPLTVRGLTSDHRIKSRSYDTQHPHTLDLIPLTFHEVKVTQSVDSS